MLPVSVFRSLFFLVFVLVAPLQMQAQGRQALPQGAFREDSVRIGQLLHYTLVFRHPPGMEVIFPDSTFALAPFEFVSKTFYPTRTDSLSSVDSAVYVLRTFETDSIQKLSLPVFILRQRDTLRLYAHADSVILRHQVQEAALQEPLAFQDRTAQVKVKERFNYPYLLLGLGSFLVLMVLVWLLFGNSLKKRYALYKLRKDYTYFSTRYNLYAERFRGSASQPNLEKAITQWKNYLTNLEQHAINSFTTKEIVAFYNDDEEMSTALRLCDRAIYGNILSSETSETEAALKMLKKFAKKRYKHYREQIKTATPAQHATPA